MAVRIDGKDLEFWFDGVEEAIEGLEPNTSFDEDESTDSSTPGDGKDFEIMMASRTFNIDAILHNPYGAEINTGTLVAENRYRVVAKDTVLAAYDVGQIFVSDGTEVMSATDKVMLLGTVITGKTIDFNFNSADVPLRELSYNVNYDTDDGSDNSSGENREVVVKRAERKTTVSGWMSPTVADLLSTLPDYDDGVITLSPSVSITGKCVPMSKSSPINVNGFALNTYELRWRGLPTEVALGLAADSEKAFKIIFKRGASTNKQYTGTCVITAKEVTASFDKVVRIKYTVHVQGAQTEAVET